MQDSDLGKRSGAFYSLANRPAVIRVETFADNLVIVHARHWLIHLQWNRLYTLAEKKTVKLLYTLVARLTKAQVKKIDDTVTTMETEAFWRL